MQLPTFSERAPPDLSDLAELMVEAKKVFAKHHKNTVWFERSVFINWSCGIADCKYCYLSTKPKKDKNAVRSKHSILAEILLCQHLGWKIGYLTGGLRVESTQELVELLKTVNLATHQKIRMNFGPYSRREIEAFAPHIGGMGVAIESFDEELHNYICPSKPLKALLNTLDVCKEKEIFTFITIILGLGEKQSDVEKVIERIREHNIGMVQLCFLKPQPGTEFSEVPPPDMEYMAWWTAQLRIACPDLIIKVAIVRERIKDFHILLDAGANCFSRFMMLNDFGSSFAKELMHECEKAGREIEGEFLEMPALDPVKMASILPEELIPKVEKQLEKYIRKVSSNVE